MRHTFRRILAMLDGKPRGSRGQSLVEMTVTFPILILMILSLAEIGFVANTYLTLMDIVRESGRRGANLDPIAWDEANDTRNFERLDCDTQAGFFNLAEGHPQSRRLPRGSNKLSALNNPYTIGVERPFGYYDAVICQAIFSMPPLEFEDMSTWGGADFKTPPERNATHFSMNDVIVSVISYARMDYNNPCAFDPDGCTTYTVDPGGKLPPSKVWIAVTGRYPLKNRYCKVAGSPDGVGDNRDPFNYKLQEFYTGWNTSPTVSDLHEISPLLGPAHSQQVRGFVFTGNAENADGCIGSRFTVQDIEQRLNETAPTTDLSAKAPNGGMIVVEFFYQHHPLFLGPLFQGFSGNPQDDPVLHIYGIFPVRAAEPTATPADE